MAGHRLQATALCLLALALCASATSGGYGYYGHRRLTQASGFHRDLLSYYYGGHRRLSSYYYGGHGHRRLQEHTPVFVRPLFGNAFMAATQHGAAAADVPIPHFLTRQLQTTGYYYGGHHRRMQSVGRSLATYYYGGHRRLTSYYYGGHH